MLKNLINLILVLYLFSGHLYSQYIEGRYLTTVFPNVSETGNHLFSLGVPQPEQAFSLCNLVEPDYRISVREYATTAENLEMNILQPVGDTLSKRPLVIICFGGGFVAGSKDHWSMRLLAQDFARRGFVSALIDYRLGMQFDDMDLSVRAVYRAIQDSRSAIRFFRADAAGADIYRVDTDHIYLGGHSAGALVAIHNAYMDKESERPDTTYAGYQGSTAFDDLGMLDEVGLNQGFNGKANAIFSLAGAIGDTLWMESSSDIPIVMFHDLNDETVVYDYGKPFDSFLYNFCGNDLADLHGSFNIDLRAASLGIPHKLITTMGRGHGVHEAPDETLYPDVVPAISEFFYDQMLKPNPPNISGPLTVCVGSDPQSYNYSGSELVYFDWEVTGGTIVDSDPTLGTITIDWNNGVTDHLLEAIAYNRFGAASDTLSTIIDLISSGSNQWITNSGEWSDENNWMEGHVPLMCEDITFPASVTANVIDILPGQNIQIKSLNMGTNNVLQLGENATFQILGME